MKIVLTGDRPTGNLHIGHYVGSLKSRVEMQNSGNYEMWVLIADVQALTDNADNPQKIRENILEVMLDYIGAGLEIGKTKFVLQSHIPAIFELPMYYANLVSINRLERNPTIKSELKMRNFGSVPAGFVYYPISQAGDITAFNADLVPVGEDQLPMIEQTREIVNSFNSTYGEVLKLPEAILPAKGNKAAFRLPGIDGQKMSKSLGNGIYLKDSPEEIKKKVMSMFTDPNHLKVEDPGEIKGNVVFTFLDAFCEDSHFEKYCPEYKNLDEMKAHYKKGGLGDMKVKRFLNDILQEVLAPIRERRKLFEDKKDYLLKILEENTNEAVEKTNQTLEKVRTAIGVNYFKEKDFLSSVEKK